ncbi:TIGR03084 family metal-binding protein [Yinghuangia soli]|uniref:TIGR03084 family metal-binding protein n=1 Tax=Yinghuangia soli TaxID=2908204 RepID=A0AA41PYQ2_9ACTN|nr:TIGR03084 family metal-binding protein [Yinghuangia soli]MCF2528022.1 TIGR03084 family metal-binding protein [Yinghuangia soli]
MARTDSTDSTRNTESAEGTDVFADLRAEGDALDALVAELDDKQWESPTPAEGWTIADQIGHLASTDELAVLAATDRDAFAAALPDLLALLQAGLEAGVSSGRRGGERGAELLARWRTGRADALAALAGHPPGTRFPWFGPPMSPAAMASGRLMETWAHGGDVADALGVRREPTGRIRHIVRLGVLARDHAFGTHGLPAPAVPFRIELSAPDGSVWAYGPEDAPQTVTGPAADFARLATRRLHRDDTALKAVGADAHRWLDIAQAFVGDPGDGRARGRRTT